MFVILRFNEPHGLVFACALFYNKLTMHDTSAVPMGRVQIITCRYTIYICSCNFQVVLLCVIFSSSLAFKSIPKMDGPPLRCHDPSMASLCDMQVALMASVQSVLAVQSERTKSLVDLIIKVDKVIDLIKKKESAETSKDEPTIKREPERDLFPEEKSGKESKKMKFG